RYYQTYLGGLGADVVTAMFGWNDHGVLLGAEGAEFRSILLRDVAGAARHLASYRTLAGVLALLQLPAQPAKPVIPAVYRPLVDADAEFDQRGKADLFSPYDIVHPNHAGHALIAELIDQRLVEQGLAPAH